MAEVRSTGVAPGAGSDEVRGRRPAIVAGVAAAALSAVGAITVAWALQTRSPCPDGYVRFVDFGPLTRNALIVLGAVGGACAVVAVPTRAHRLAAGVAIGSLCLAVVGAALAILVARSYGQPGACWTF